jgi:hypothetical protein
MDTTRTNILGRGPLVLTAVTALALVTPAATAQSASADDADSAAAALRQLIDGVQYDEQDGDHVIGVWTDDDGHTHAESRTVEVSVENGEVTVWLDGEKIPVSRIRKDDQRIVVLDRDGNEVESINIGFVGGGDHHIDFRLGDGNKFRARLDRLGEVAEPPSVMLGIHLDVPGPALERHLRLDPGTTTMIGALYEGLPAHEAGLDEFDIITRIDGKTPADPAALRAALADAEPGDVIRLSVIHEGEKRTASVTLAAYDAEAMQSAKMIGTIGPQGMGQIRILGEGEHGFFSPEMDFTFDTFDLKDMNRFFLDEDKRLFEFAPDGKPFRFKHRFGPFETDDESDADADADVEFDEDGDMDLDRRLERLEQLLDELMREIGGS